MDSLNLFNDKPISVEAPKAPRARPLAYPLWLILILSSLIPGLGHWMLGKKREGLAILGSVLGLSFLAGFATMFNLGNWTWIGMRGSTLVALFAISDATLLCQETADGREHEYPDRPRLVGFLNLVGYGAGYWLADERKWAYMLGIPAVLFHVLLSNVGTAGIWFGEVLLLGAAIHGFWLTRQLRRKPAGGSYTDRTPGWVLPSLGSVWAVALLLIIMSQSLSIAYRDALEVDQARAVAVEPYYMNPRYGLELQMNSPGWAFGPVATDEFVSARHVAEDVSVRMVIRPRVPGVPGQDEVQAQMALEEARQRGYYLTPQGGRPVQLGELLGFELDASGQYGGQPRQVRVLTAGKGFRQYVLWCEWGGGRSTFATSEIDHMITTLRLE